MKFNSFKQLTKSEADELQGRVLGAFYARYPDVQTAVCRDSLTFGYLTEKTQKMIRIALDRDAGMRGALENISCDPHARGNPHVFHNEWEEFSMQLVGYAREALGAPSLSPQERRCQKCAEVTEGEEAWVDGEIWCHPCADAQEQRGTE